MSKATIRNGIVIGADYSTLDLEKLRALPVVKMHKDWHLGTVVGAGCFMDAPGFPSYFIVQIYNRHGNDASDKFNGAIVTPDDGEIHGLPSAWGQDGYDSAKWSDLLRSLWKPLPLDNPRVEKWIRVCYSYFRDCYQNPYLPEEERAQAAKLDTYHLERAKYHHPDGTHVALHNATCWIRRFYPEFQGREDLIENPPNDYGHGNDDRTWEVGNVARY